MRIERTKNATRNIIFGIILKAYQILVPFIMRTAMIYFLGVQYLGLNSLFTSVLQVLNLAELGVGSAMIFSMYKPIAENDETTICALMKMYKIYYRFIGLIIAIVGGVLTPFIPKLISGTVPNDINVYILYLLNLGSTVLSYWLFAYKNSILQAHQRIDIISKVTLLTNTLQYALQIIVLIVFKNYYYYVIVMLLTQALTNIFTAMVADKIYPQYKPKGKISSAEVHRINRRIRDLFTSKIGAVIYDSADTIVISSFLGLTMLAVYQNYFYILSAITAFIAVIFAACTAGIGNSLVMDTKEKNYNDFKKFTFIIIWISGFCSTALLCIYQPFMELWVGKDLMLSNLAVVCFVIYFFVRQLNSLFTLYKDASGMWHEDRFRPLAAALTNLFLNLVLVRFIGIYGILLSTVIAIVIVGMPWLLHNLFTVVFEKKYLKHFVKKLIGYCIIVILSCFITSLICSFINTKPFITIIFRGLICLMVPNMLYYIIFKKTLEYNQLLLLINKMTKSKFTGVLKRIGLKI